MKTLTIIVNDTLELLEDYAESNQYSYPEDIGYTAIKKCAIKALQNDGVKNPGKFPYLINPVIEIVESELTATQFEKIGLGINP